MTKINSRKQHKKHSRSLKARKSQMKNVKITRKHKKSSNKSMSGGGRGNKNVNIWTSLFSRTASRPNQLVRYNTAAQHKRMKKIAAKKRRTWSIK